MEMMTHPPLLWVQTWKKRWFVLTAGIEGQEEAKLQYFPSQKASDLRLLLTRAWLTTSTSFRVQDTEALGTIMIGERTKVARTADDRFEINTLERTYFLITSGEEDCTQWVDILNYIVGDRGTTDGSLEDAYMMQVGFRGWTFFLTLGLNPLPRLPDFGVPRSTNRLPQDLQANILCPGRAEDLLLYR